MKFQEHCEETKRIFGKAFEEVHRWLDEYSGTPEFGMRHRKVRHHENGIREAIKIFGEEAEKVARQHIISDLIQEGWIDGTHPFPKNEKHYVKMGLF